MPRRFFATLLLCAVAGASAASPTDWGILGPVGADADATTAAPGPVDDVYAFSFETPAQLDVLATSVVTVSPSGEILTDLAGGTVALYAGVADDGLPDAFIFAFAFGTDPTEYLIMDLDAGAYYLEVSGTATGTQGSEYTLHAQGDVEATPFPVPEPASAPLLLAGLGAIAWLRRRA